MCLVHKHIINLFGQLTVSETPISIINNTNIYLTTRCIILKDNKLENVTLGITDLKYRILSRRYYV
jgi:hypothetical protein